MTTDNPVKEEIPAAVFGNFDAFVQVAIKDYYARGWKSRRANFVAFLIASGQMASLAKDSLSGDEGIKRVAIGAASLVGLRLALRYALSGPLGIILAGAGVASLVAFFLKNQKDITAKLGAFRQLIETTRQKFDEIQAGFRAGRYDVSERNLMIDGLLKRFLVEIDEV